MPHGPLARLVVFCLAVAGCGGGTVPEGPDSAVTGGAGGGGTGGAALDATDVAATGGTGSGGSSSGGTGGVATGGTGGSGGTSARSDLPIPPGGGVDRPTGPASTVTVLNWAGFKSAVSWTFDDGQPSHITYYAALNAVGVPMTFYITTANSGSSGFDTTWAQAVRDGHELGNHTVHHCYANLTGCSSGSALADVGAELDQCSTYIAQRYSPAVAWTLAAPFGDAAYASPARSRFLVNRGVGAGTIGPNDSTDAFNLPVHMATTGETAASFNTATDSARSAGRWIIFLIHTITPTNANWYAPIALTELTAGMNHGKALEDVWTDTVVEIAAYWRAQKMFSGLTPTVSGSSRTWTWTLPAHFPPGRHLRVTTNGGTLSQNGTALTWDPHGYYEVALDAGSLTLSP